MSVYVDRMGVCPEVPIELLHGLQYGEGAFETIRIDEHRGIEWCEAHWSRWQKGLAYLGVDVNSHLRLEDWITAIKALAKESDVQLLGWWLALKVSSQMMVNFGGGSNGVREKGGLTP